MSHGRLLLVALLLLTAAPVRSFEYSVELDEEVLRHAGIPADGPALLDFVRRCTPVYLSAEDITGALRQLGDADFRVRERALRQLQTAGPLAEPQLRRALQDADDEIAARAVECLRLLHVRPFATVQKSAIRLLVDREPPGTLDALLAFAPFASDPEVTAEISRTLVILVQRRGTLTPAVLAALEDESPARRALAAEVVCQAGAAARPRAAYPLLLDAHPEVRLRAALALVRCKDRSAIPVLIELLPELPLYQVNQVEEILSAVAGDAGPPLTLLNPDPLDKIRDDWRDWWHKHGAQVRLR